MRRGGHGELIVFCIWWRAGARRGRAGAFRGGAGGKVDFWIVHMIMSVIDCTCCTISYMDSPTDAVDPIPTNALIPTRAALGFDSLKALVLEGVSSPHTRRSYEIGRA